MLQEPRLGTGSSLSHAGDERPGWVGWNSDSPDCSTNFSSPCQPCLGALDSVNSPGALWHDVMALMKERARIGNRLSKSTFSCLFVFGSDLLRQTRFYSTPGFPGTHCVTQADLKCDSPASVS